MGNMSYCRFSNTCGDLADCVDALAEEGLPESKRELKALKRMRELCKRIIEDTEPGELLDAAIEAASD